MIESNHKRKLDEKPTLSGPVRKKQHIEDLIEDMDTALDAAKK